MPTSLKRGEVDSYVYLKEKVTSNTCYISTMDTKVVYSWQELGTSDFLVHYFNHALYTRTTDTKPNTCFMKLIYVGYLFG